MNKTEKPLVSICVITYNHEQFLARALDSILSQEMDFQYEIIIGEDCSQDATRAICEQYKQNYSDVIQLILHEKNVGLIRNYVSIMTAAKGKYIAICSGDDYWCDSMKLKKQVAFLEQNIDYSMCFTNAYEESNFSWEGYQKKQFSNVEDREYKGDQIILDWIIPASSVMIRNGLLDFSFLLKRTFYAEDLVQYLKLNEYGKLRGMSDITTTYTRHENAITSNIISREKTLKKYVVNLLSIDVELNYKYRQIIKKDLSIVYYNEAKYMFKHVSCFTALTYFARAFWYNPICTINLLYKSVID